MNSPPGKQATAGFALIELLVIAVVLLVLLVLLLPARLGPNRPPASIRCMSNLRQIGLALRMFAEDNHKQFPAQQMATNLSSVGSFEPGSPALYFAPLQPYLRRVQEVWICPTDQVKTPGTNFTQFDNRNVSYFLSVDLTPAVTSAILAGDRHLKAEGQPVKPGLFSLATNSNMGWTRELHPIGRVPRGTLLFVDCHAQFVGTNFAALVRRQPLAVNRLAVP